MYETLYTVCDLHIEKCVKNSIMLENASNSEQFLDPISNLWTNHKQEMDAIRQIFLMLDKTYVRLELKDIKSLWNMGITISEFDISLQAMCPGNLCTSGTMIVACFSQDEPHTPFPLGIRVHATGPWNGPK